MADDIITLYHGSGSLFSTFDLSLCKPRIDFGRGLYLTSNKDQAIGMAYRKRAAGGHGYLYTYQMSTADTKQLTKLSFKTPSIDWIDFIISNRTARVEYMFGYDVVIGPTADANVTGYMYRYLNGALGVPGSLAAREALLRAVKPDIYSRQICLHTQRAINCAVLVDRKTV